MFDIPGAEDVEALYTVVRFKVSPEREDLGTILPSVVMAVGRHCLVHSEVLPGIRFAFIISFVNN
jgi:hypothetical protein